MRILVFGRNGQVGSALCSALRGAHETAAFAREDADLLAAGAAERLILEHRPDIVINAAAYTAVDRAQSDEDAAFRLNCDAPAEMAIAARAAGARFIHLSTDYVFNGSASAPYRETDAVNPINVYGRSKAAGENAVLAADPSSVILRVSWVFSDTGSNFVKTMLRLAQERDALQIVDDQIGGPTSAAAIAAAIIRIAEKIYRGADGRGIYHFQGAPAVSWADFARAIFEEAGCEIAVGPIATKDFPTPARRPLYGVLDCSRIEADFGVAQPDWRTGLAATIKRLKETERVS